MFSSPFLVLSARYRACLGPSGFRPSCLSLIPAEHPTQKTASRGQPSKQIHSSHYWLSAVSCQLPNPAALVRDAPHQSVPSSCLSPAPLRARWSNKTAPLSPLAATLTKNIGKGTKSIGERAHLRTRLPLHARTAATLFHSIVYFITCGHPGWGGRCQPGPGTLATNGHPELDYVEWNPALCIAVRASGFFMNVSQTRPLR